MILILVLWFGLPGGAGASGESLGLTKVLIIYPISSPVYPVVLKGRDLGPLLDVPVGRIALFAVHDQKIEPIPFQIDCRDKEGVFQIQGAKEDQEKEDGRVFDMNDECVFMSSDLGEKAVTLPEIPGMTSAAEIEIRDPETGRQAWAYALVFDGTPPECSGRDYVSYNAESDFIDTAIYRIGFSGRLPFLVDRMNLKKAGTHELSPDFTDTMKIRYSGKLFHRFDFLRTQDDFTSEIAAVKDGPVRVIRRTANKVRIFGWLKTPEILIDYIGYPQAFFSDTLVRIPFRASWFFSDLETLMTMDQSGDPALPRIKAFSRTSLRGVTIDGTMSEDKKAFNATGDHEFMVSSSYGKTLVELGLEKDFPIQYRVYLMDDRDLPDPPEEIPGQFGNLGFFSNGWENVDTSLHHMLFTVYFAGDVTVEQGFRILEKAPSFVGK